MGALAAATRGLAAGFAGTVALTASQRLEMALSGRPASDLPAQVAEGLFGITAEGERRERVATAMHWANNTQAGLGRAVLDAAGLRGAPALLGTFATYHGGSVVLFQRLGLPPPRTVDLAHAAVWALACDAAWRRLA